MTRGKLLRNHYTEDCSKKRKKGALLLEDRFCIDDGLKGRESKTGKQYEDQTTQDKGFKPPASLGTQAKGRLQKLH